MRTDSLPAPMPTTRTSPTDALRSATGLVVSMLRLGGSDDPAELRRRTLDAARIAAAGREDPSHRFLEAAEAEAWGSHELTISVDGVFPVIRDMMWAPLDDAKAERFYEVVADCVDHFIASPAARLDSIPPPREALADVGRREAEALEPAAALADAAIGATRRLAEALRYRSGLEGEGLARAVLEQVNTIFQGSGDWTRPFPGTEDGSYRRDLYEQAEEMGLDPGVHIEAVDAAMNVRAAIQSRIGPRMPNEAEWAIISEAIQGYLIAIACGADDRI